MNAWVLIVLSAALTPDLSGRWARKTVNVAESEVPVIGKIEARTTALAIVDVKKSGDGYALVETICSLQTKTLGGVVETNYPAAFLRQVSGRKKAANVDADKWLETETQTYLHGAKDVRPDEALPERGSDKITDPDHDGKPGLTVKVDGFITGEVYVVERSRSTMKGSVISPRHIRGIVDWTADQRVVGASRDALDTQPSVKPADNGSHFEMKRIPKRATCRQLLARQQRLFAPKS